MTITASALYYMFNPIKLADETWWPPGLEYDACESEQWVVRGHTMHGASVSAIVSAEFAARQIFAAGMLFLAERWYDAPAIERSRPPDIVYFVLGQATNQDFCRVSGQRESPWHALAEALAHELKMPKPWWTPAQSGSAG